MQDERAHTESASSGRGWPRAVALLGVALSTSVVQPTVLMALPFVVLVSVFGIRRALTLPVVVLAVLIAVGGARDGLWYLERAWAMLLGGSFAALTLLRPKAVASARALGSVAGAAVLGGGFLALAPGSWSAIDWTVSDRLITGVRSVLDALASLRGDALPPALITALYETTELQIAVFPALLALKSMAAVAVTWWLYVRLANGHDRGLGPLRDFRFNDHLVWLFIGGMVLVVARAGDAFARVGSNAVIFMGALYALRGAAVIVFISGGLSVLSYVFLALALLVVTPLVLGAAIVVGLGDTWLGFRERTRAVSA